MSGIARKEHPPFAEALGHQRQTGRPGAVADDLERQVGACRAHDDAGDLGIFRDLVRFTVRPG